MFGDKRRPTATIAAEIDRIIGLNIRRAREDVRLGQHDVTSLLGISVHVLARYEEGQERAPASVLLELTRHVGCQLTDLFAGMPSLEVEDEFPGSRPAPAPAPVPDASADRRLNDPRPPAEPATLPPVRPDPVPTGREDAAAVASIIRAFAALQNPVVREKLLGLLQALA